MKLLIALLTTLALSTQAMADERSDRLDDLFGFLKSAQTEAEGHQIAGRIWEVWFDGPTAEDNALMSQAMRFRRQSDMLRALETFDDLIARTPDWAEAWNQRAFQRYLMDDLDGSLADIAETLAREPRHFGALSGMAQILAKQGDAEGAQDVIRRALKHHPWMRERAILGDGEDI